MSHANFFVLLALALLGCGGEGGTSPAGPVPAACLRDHVWVWGNPENEPSVAPSATTFAASSPAQRASLVGVHNLILAGDGIPADPEVALSLTEAARPGNRLVWEIQPDDAEGGGFAYRHRLTEITFLADRFPGALTGVLLDDMSSRAIAGGMRPAHIAAIREQLAGRPLEIWGVTYLHDLALPRLSEYLAQVDVVSLWVWEPAQLPQLDSAYSRLTRLAPGKQYSLGLYLYDFANDRPIASERMERQLATAAAWLQSGKVRDVVLLTIVEAPEAVSRVTRWVAELDGGRACVTPSP